MKVAASDFLYDFETSRLTLFLLKDCPCRLCYALVSLFVDA